MALRRGRLVVVAVWALVVTVAPAAWANLGEVDTTFGRNGVVRTNFGWGGRGSAAQVLLRQADGKIVAGARAWDGGPACALVRYSADGSVDPSFGEEGRAVTQIGDDRISRPGVSDVVQQADGKLVAIGEASGISGPNFAIVRYEADGTADMTFGEHGVVIVTSDQYDEPRAVAVRPDGRIVVAGTRYTESGDLRIVSLLLDGTLDRASASTARSPSIWAARSGCRTWSSRPTDESS